MRIRIAIIAEDAEPGTSTHILGICSTTSSQCRPGAQLAKESAEPHAKGGVVAVGQIVLALITGGAVGKLIDTSLRFSEPKPKADSGSRKRCWRKAEAHCRVH